MGIPSITALPLFVVSTILLLILVLLDHFPTAAGFQLIQNLDIIIIVMLLLWQSRSIGGSLRILVLPGGPGLDDTGAGPAPTPGDPSCIVFGRTDAEVPTTVAVRNRDRADAVKAAMANPLVLSCRCIRCEFPALAALNKLGNGSSRSAM
jgi:hypothetical protein